MSSILNERIFYVEMKKQFIFSKSYQAENDLKALCLKMSDGFTRPLVSIVFLFQRSFAYASQGYVFQTGYSTIYAKIKK